MQPSISPEQRWTISWNAEVQKAWLRHTLTLPYIQQSTQKVGNKGQIVIQWNKKSNFTLGIRNRSREE